MSIRFFYLLSIFCLLCNASASGGRGPRGTRGRIADIDQRRVKQDDVASDSSNVNDSNEVVVSGDSKGKGNGGSKKKKGSKKAPKKRDCEISEYTGSASPSNAMFYFLLSHSPISLIFKTEEKNNRVEYKCKTNSQDTGGIVDEIEFKVDTSDRLKVNIEYRETIETNSSNTNTDTETQYEIAFDRIIEYTKPNSTSSDSEAYDWVNDEIVQEMQLTDWQSFSGISNDAGGVVSSFDVVSVDNTVAFTFKVARADDGNMTANSMKIDFELMNFSWVHTDSYVALVSTVTSKRNVGVHNNTKRKDVSDVLIDFVGAVNTVGFVPFGSFTWATTADAAINGTKGDSITINVIATSAPPSGRRLMDNGTIETIAFSFVGAGAKGSSDIYWDPEAGIGYDTSGGRRFGVYMGAAIGVVAFVVLIIGVVIMRRRRGRVSGRQNTGFKSGGNPALS